tara:strand:+ start:1195 stop:1749 length:555 start_codon:yes stop_codon:yes gene_type:complete
MRDFINIENFVSDEDCQEYIDHFDDMHGDGYRRTDDDAPWFNDRVVCFTDTNPEIKKKLWQLSYSYSGVISNFYKEGPIYPETINICRWAEGDELGLHGDAKYYPNGEDNYVYWRSHSVVTFLNSDFSGGEFYFHTGHIIEPKWGSIVGFDSSVDHAHGVKKVTEGFRYTVAMWFTMDEKYRLF